MALNLLDLAHLDGGIAEIKMGLVFTNLVDNALKYTPSGGEISIEAMLQSNIVRNSISDTGAGVPDEVLSYIFERFYQVDSSRSNGADIIAD